MSKIKNKNCQFAQFGGSYLPNELQIVIDKLSKNYQNFSEQKKFQKELKYLYENYANRPSLLYRAKRLEKLIDGPRIYLKREDLNHTGAHKINNALGQGLLAKKMGKQKLIAETGAGQHGVATATVAAYFGLACDVYMGQRDIKAQKSNVYRMKILGAKVIPVRQGQGTLKDAVDVALKNFIKEKDSAYYLLGSVVGPHPYPTMVRNFQKIIGQEIKEQILAAENCLPNAIIACVGGGSNAMGAFYDFIENKETQLIAVEPAGKGIKTKRHGLSLFKGKTGLIHGFKTLLLLKKSGEIQESYSIASGLDYPGVGPELSMLKEAGRLTLGQITDSEALEAFKILAKNEGIIPALESAHAVAYLLKNKKNFKKDALVVINLSGRGDKDVEQVYNLKI